MFYQVIYQSACSHYTPARAMSSIRIVAVVATPVGPGAKKDDCFIRLQLLLKKICSQNFIEIFQDNQVVRS